MNEYSYFPVFWNGKHLNAGEKKEWTVSDVYNIFTNTVNKGGRIPFTIDHPANDLPIIGFTDVNNIRFVHSDSRAIIEVKPIEFAQDILKQIKKTGRRHVSIALSPDDYSIRHIGLVEKPAVKNLPAIPFTETTEPITIMLEHETALLPEVSKDKDIEFSENENLKAELEKLKNIVESLKRERESLTKEKKELEFKQYLVENYRERIPPSIMPQVLRIMLALDGQPAYEFTQNNETKTATALDEFKILLNSLSSFITFEEYATKDKINNINSETIDLDKIIAEFNKHRK